MPRKASKPKNASPKNGAQAAHETKSVEGSGGGDITKSEAVRRAISAGFDKPVEGVAYIKDQFGIDIGPTHFSAVKTTEKKKEEAKAKGKPGRKPKSYAFEGNSASASKPAAKTGSDLLAAMEAMKPLVAALGAEKVKRIADLLG
jgi:hypothetical protein